MKNLFAALKKMLISGEDAVLVTVTESRGSVPRGAGARMLVGRRGWVSGSVGGGAVEQRGLAIAAEVLRDKRPPNGGAESVSAPRTEIFRLRQSEIEDLGMVCGGEVTLSFEFFAAGDEKALSRCDALEARSKQAGLVYIFGGGHVAQALVPILAAVDFRCVLLEDREEFCQPALFPGAENCRLIGFARIEEAVSLGAEDYAVILTRGHKYDQCAAAAALKSPARYIGVIGSKRKSALMFENLRKMGFTDEDLKRVTTPIGLPILAETPAEIAISIAAQLIELRAEKERNHT